MASENQIVLELVLDDGQVLKALGKVQDKAKQTKDELEKDSGGGFLSKKLGDLSVGFGLMAVAAKKAMDVMVDAFSKGIAEAREQEKAITDLSAGLAIHGRYSQAAVKSFENFASALSQTTGIADDLIISNASLLTSLNGLSGAGLERATKAAVELSAATGKDLSYGFRAVSMAAEGNVAGLGKIGIKIDETIPKSERFAKALELIEKKFSGLAAAKADSFEGTLNKLGNAGNDLYKVFGNIVTQSPVFRKSLVLVTNALEYITDFLTKGLKGKDLFGDLIVTAMKVARGLVYIFGPPIETLVRGFFTGVKVIEALMTGLSVVFWKTVQKFNEYLATPIMNFFGITLGSIVAIFDEELGLKLTKSFDDFSASINDSSKMTAEKSAGYFEQSWSGLSKTVGEGFKLTVTNAAWESILGIEKTLEKTKTLTNAFDKHNKETADGIVTRGMYVSESFVAIYDGAHAAADDFAKSAMENFRKVGQSAFQFAGQAVGQAFAAFGKALAKGENAINALLDSFLASFGQMAIQLGTQFILQGIAYSWAGGPLAAQGPPLIAAGAALATFGGVLSALGGGGAAASGGGAGASAGVTNPSENPTAPLEDQPEFKQQERIVINIQGDVLDSDDTGSRIVRLLSDYADKNGNGAVIA